MGPPNLGCMVCSSNSFHHLRRGCCGASRHRPRVSVHWVGSWVPQLFPARGGRSRQTPPPPLCNTPPARSSPTPAIAQPIVRATGCACSCARRVGRLTRKARPEPRRPARTHLLTRVVSGAGVPAGLDAAAFWLSLPGLGPGLFSSKPGRTADALPALARSVPLGPRPWLLPAVSDAASPASCALCCGVGRSGPCAAVLGSIPEGPDARRPCRETAASAWNAATRLVVSKASLSKAAGVWPGRGAPAFGVPASSYVTGTSGRPGQGWVGGFEAGCGRCMSTSRRARPLGDADQAPRRRPAPDLASCWACSFPPSIPPQHLSPALERGHQALTRHWVGRRPANQAPRRGKLHRKRVGAVGAGGRSRIQARLPPLL